MTRDEKLLNVAGVGGYLGVGSLFREAAEQVRDLYGAREAMAEGIAGYFDALDDGRFGRRWRRLGPERVRFVELIFGDIDAFDLGVELRDEVGTEGPVSMEWYLTEFIGIPRRCALESVDTLDDYMSRDLLEKRKLAKDRPEESVVTCGLAGHNYLPFLAINEVHSAAVAELKGRAEAWPALYLRSGLMGELEFELTMVGKGADKL